MDNASDSYSSDSSEEVVRDSDWYKKNFLKSGRILTQVAACYVTFIASFDVESVMYDSDPAPNYFREGEIAMFLTLRFCYVFIGILVYIMVCRIYDHSMGIACIIVGFVFAAGFFISLLHEATEFLRMFIELPFRFFGTTYIQALAMAVIFNWSFFGLELRKAYRVWLCCIKGGMLVGMGVSILAPNMRIGHGIPGVYIIHGCILAGAGIIFTCGFDHVASTDSVKVTRWEKEALEKDHCENGIFTSSESSVFKSMPFLSDVLKDGRHIFSITIMLSAEYIESLSAVQIGLIFNVDSTLVLVVSTVACLVFWAIVSTIIDIRIERMPNISKRYTTRPTIVLSLGVVLILADAVFAIMPHYIFSSPAYVAVIVLQQLLRQGGYSHGRKTE